MGVFLALRAPGDRVCAHGGELQVLRHCAAVVLRLAQDTQALGHRSWFICLSCTNDSTSGLPCCFGTVCRCGLLRQLEIFGPVSPDNTRLVHLCCPLGSFSFAWTLPQRAAGVCESVYMCAVFHHGMPDVQIEQMVGFALHSGAPLTLMPGPAC